MRASGSSSADALPKAGDAAALEPPVMGAQAPPRRPRLWGWPAIRRGFFGGWLSSALTLGLGTGLIWIAVRAIEWGLVKAVWIVPGSGDRADTSACRAVEGQGACWAVIHEKFRLILFGLYPYPEQWRPALVIAIFVALYAASAQRRFWRPVLAAFWILALTAVGMLMWGGVLGLAYVPEDQWGGLPVSLLLATFGLAFAFPFAVLVALGRRSHLAGLPGLCATYVELIRGIPLVSVLFMASVMFPLFLPPGVEVSKLLRAQVAIAIFEAAYLSEIVRAGLRALPPGQEEAGAALGLGYWRKVLLVLLPQALRLSMPALANAFISFFKATTLVTVIGVFDLLTAAKRSVGETAWQGFGTEAYLFVAMIFFVICASISSYSRHLERWLARAAPDG
jgi:general L-amino acid transport system permease protein